jgi:hypothetical protein
VLKNVEEPLEKQQTSSLKAKDTPVEKPGETVTVHEQAKEDSFKTETVKSTNYLQLQEALNNSTFQSGTHKDNLPAFLKFRHLVGNDKLTLPQSYIDLEKRFNALEHAIMFQKANRANSYFHKLQKSVENMCNRFGGILVNETTYQSAFRAFTLQHLAQIMHVFPEAYTLTPARCLLNGDKVLSLLIEVKSDHQADQAVHSAYTGSLFAKESLERRKLFFHKRLLEIVDKEHQVRYQLAFAPLLTYSF